MDCFASLAMTCPNSRRNFTISRRDAPEALLNRPPNRGVGNAGCPLHPQPRVHFALVERTRVNEYTGITDVPARKGFNVSFRALPVTGSFATVVSD